MKAVVFTFGRFNPPTIGHMKLIEKIAKVAKQNSADYRIFLSRSQDSDKNPLSLKDKVKYLKLSAPRYKSAIQSEDVVNVFDVLVNIHEAGYEKAIMVVGSDRVSEFNTLIRKYNGRAARHGSYEFKEIEVVSAGERDPDAEDVSGMSASKLRTLASENNFEGFKLGVSPNLSDRNAKKLFDAVRSGMQIRESVKTFGTFLNEGVYDVAALKAFFMAGGSGSGKSYVAEMGVTPERYGLKVVNSDDQFERALKKINMSSNLTALSKDDIQYAMDVVRPKAKKLTDARKALYLKGRLGLLIDGTAHDFDLIKRQRQDLMELGYDVYMVFVKTTLEVALERNRNRPRVLPDELVTSRWHDVNTKSDDYHLLFGSKYIAVPNNNVGEKSQKILRDLFTKVGKIIKKPVRNVVGKRWIAKELEIKNTTK